MAYKSEEKKRIREEETLDLLNLELRTVYSDVNIQNVEAWLQETHQECVEYSKQRKDIPQELEEDKEPEALMIIM